MGRKKGKTPRRGMPAIKRMAGGKKGGGKKRPARGRGVEKEKSCPKKSRPGSKRGGKKGIASSKSKKIRRHFPNKEKKKGTGFFP